MKTMACHLVLLAALGLRPALAQENPAIGRLFSPVVVTGNTLGGERPLPNRIRVDGAVVRSSKANTIWINGVPFDQANGPLASKTRPGELPSVSLRPPTTPAVNARPIALRVGESLDLNDQKQRDVVPAGAISVRKSP